METEKLRGRIKQHWAEGLNEAQIEWKYDDRRVIPLIEEMIASGELEAYRFWMWDLSGVTAREAAVLTGYPLKACLAEGFMDLPREQLSVGELREYVVAAKAASEVPKPVLVQIIAAWGSWARAYREIHKPEDDPWYTARNKYF